MLQHRQLRPRTLLLAGLLAATHSPAQGSKPPQLKDGEPFTLRAKLQIVHQGWRSYLVLPLDHPYLADFGPDQDSKQITALELNPLGNYATVAEHAGESVEARGKLQIDGTSPHYWNGVMLMASALSLPNGVVLYPSTPPPVSVSLPTTLYVATVAMVPHQYEWRREARDPQTGRPLPEPAPAHLDGCALNGAGDTMNCTCTPGFVPVRAGVVPQALPPNRWRELPVVHQALPGMAQFALEDPDAHHTQVVQVACQREGSKHP